MQTNDDDDDDIIIIMMVLLLPRGVGLSLLSRVNKQGVFRLLGVIKKAQTGGRTRSHPIAAAPVAT